MHGDPPAAPDPDRTDLTLPALYPGIDPDTRLPRRPLAPDAIPRLDGNRHLFQAPQIPSDIRMKFFQVQDGIAHDLPRSMKSDIPAPVDPE